MISTLTSGAAIGGILAGGINLFSQWALGAEMPDIKSLVTSTVFGGITGALSVGASIFSTGTQIAIQLGTQVALNVGISLGAYVLQNITLLFQKIESLNFLKDLEIYWKILHLLQHFERSLL